MGQSGRYFIKEDGRPFFMVGRQINFTWGDFWQLYESNDTSKVDLYLSQLSNKGINTLRLFCEDLFPGHDYLFESDITTGTLNSRTESFLLKILDIGDKYGIYFILSPWDTMYMGDGNEWFDRWSTNQYFTKGVIGSPGDFYRTDNPNGLNDMQKRRLSSIIRIIGGHRNVILELINEIDGRWQMPYIHKNEYGAPWRATWFPAVVQPWLEMMRDHVRSEGHSGLLSFSTSVEFPSIQSELDFLYRLPGFDFLLYHPYFLNQSACNTWPCNLLQDWPEFAIFCEYGVRCAADPSLCSFGTNGCIGEHVTIQPARDMRDAAHFSLMFSGRPYVDGEDGPIFRGGGYGPDFSRDNDIEAFHNQQWANVASGAASSGIRHPQGVLEINDSLLLPEMDDIQGTISKFFQNGALIDLNRFDAISIDTSIRLSSSDGDVVKIGLKDSANQAAIIFLLVDKAHVPDGDIGNITVTISNLSPHEVYRIEEWQTFGFYIAPKTVNRFITDDNGLLAFNHNLQTSAVFKITYWQPETSLAEELPGALGISAMVKTEEKGPVTGEWKEGGRTTTERGDGVVWGHFYVSPSEVPWGDPNNPDAFVKVWFDVSGRIDVNFFHVSVPDIDVYSAFKSPSIWTGTGRITMDNRYVRHEYWGVLPTISNSTFSGGERREDGYNITEDLNIRGVFYPSTSEAFPSAWREEGRETTARGDQVIWGFFYADTVDRTWGNADNPDVYVKIWYDVSGRIDINFFHVSVPEISVTSSFRNGIDSQTDTVTMENRYIRHEYQR